MDRRVAAVSAAMSHYRRADTIGDVEIYQRRDGLAEPGDAAITVP